MRLPTFAVVLQSENKEVFDRLRKTYDFYALTPTVAVVRAERTLTQDVAKQAGVLKPPEGQGVPGVVFKLNRTAVGYYWTALWEWLDQDNEAD